MALSFGIRLAPTCAAAQHAALRLEGAALVVAGAALGIFASSTARKLLDAQAEPIDPATIHVLRAAEAKEPGQPIVRVTEWTLGKAAAGAAAAGSLELQVALSGEARRDVQALEVVEMRWDHDGLRTRRRQQWHW